MKLPPINLEAEQSFIGCAINDPSVMRETNLTGEDFYKLEHQKIFSTLSQLENYDLIVLKEHLKDTSFSYIANLSANSGVQWKEYEKIIKNKANYRRLITKYQQLEQACYEEVPLEEITKNNEELNLLVEESTDIKILPVITAKNLIEAAQKSREMLLSGLPLADRYLTCPVTGQSGFATGDLTIVSGPTGHGKTTYCQELTYQFALQTARSLWFSFEINPRVIAAKFNYLGINEDDWVYLPFDNKLRLSNRLGWIKEAIKKAKKKFNIKAVFIDHLGYLTPEARDVDKTLSQNYSTFISSLCRSLKLFAVRENISIFLLAHIGKKPEETEPTINDLRDSSGIAQEADTVILLQRELNKDQGPNNPDYYTDNVKILFPKNRIGGKTFSLWARFNQGHYEEINRFDIEKKPKIKL